VFEEKQDLLPFEEVKLYGHNATHALAAYVGAMRGVQRIADLVDVPGAMSFLESAFIQESGESLIRRHGNMDLLFTPAGYQEYALDLLKRMTNPYLLDTVERVGRDPERKLGWDDRILGTMRISYREGVMPRRYAFGAASALATLDRSVLDADSPLPAILDQIWNAASPDASEREAMLGLIEEGRVQLKLWRRAGHPSLEGMFPQSVSRQQHSGLCDRDLPDVVYGPVHEIEGLDGFRIACDPGLMNAPFDTRKELDLLGSGFSCGKNPHQVSQPPEILPQLARGFPAKESGLNPFPHVLQSHGRFPCDFPEDESCEDIGEESSRKRNVLVKGSAAGPGLKRADQAVKTFLCGTVGVADQIFQG
jgi:hypothetical protein